LRENLVRYGANNETEDPESFGPGDFCTDDVFVGENNSSFAQGAYCRRSSGCNSPASGRGGST
jgi:hypothetical protein